MKKYSEFVNSLHESKLEEASGKNYIDVFDEDKPYGDPLYRVHRNELIEEIKELLLGKENGYLQRVTVFASLPSHGKNKPSYLADTLPEIGQDPMSQLRKETPGEEPKIDWKGSSVDPEDDSIDIKGDEDSEIVPEIGWKEAGIEWGGDDDEEKDVYKDDEEDVEADDTDDDEEYDDESPEKERWVDSEFEVVDVDEVNNLVVAMPYSLRRKKITTPIHPKYIHEITYKKVRRNAP
jgi:hypothetical protein